MMYVARKIEKQYDDHGLDEKLKITASPTNNTGSSHTYSFGLDDGRQEKMVGLLAFQSGPRFEPGSRDGLSSMSVLAVMIDHLSGFQNGPFPSECTEEAVGHLNAALSALRRRADERARRGVLGKNEK